NPEARAAVSIEVTAHVLHAASVFGDVPALPAYAGGDEWLAAQVDYLRGNRDFLEKEIDLPMAHVEATYLAWIDCSSLGVADPYAHFLAHGVALLPGAQFDDPRLLKLTVGHPRARLTQAHARLRRPLSPSPSGSRY